MGATSLANVTGLLSSFAAKEIPENVNAALNGNTWNLVIIDRLLSRLMIAKKWWEVGGGKNWTGWLRKLFLRPTTYNLFGPVSRWQHFVSIHSHHQVHNLVGCNFAEPVRCVRGNDYHVARAHFAAHTVFHHAAAGAGAVENLNHRALRRRLSRTLNHTACYKRSVAFNNVIDLRDLAVLYATARASPRGFR